jgi:5-methyltetrahydropteroyltriglutamate--homocysteine methyltransferase
VKVTLPGPFTMTQQAQNDYYPDDESLALAYAAAVNEEARDLRAAGVDVIQIDEPYLQVRPAEARAYGLAAVDRALDGVAGETALHLCFGYGHVVDDKPSAYSLLQELNGCSARQVSIEAAQPDLDLSVLRRLPAKTIVLGVLDLADEAPVETPQQVADRIRQALEHAPPERLVAAPDCGMKYLPRDVAFAKLEAMVEGAAIVRRELAGGGED